MMLSYNKNDFTLILFSIHDTFFYIFKCNPFNHLHYAKPHILAPYFYKNICLFNPFIRMPVTISLSRVSEYTISYYEGDNSLNWETVTIPANVTHHRVRGLTPGATYHFRVQGQSYEYISPPSQVITYTLPTSTAIHIRGCKPIYLRARSKHVF